MNNPGTEKPGFSWKRLRLAVGVFLAVVAAVTAAALIAGRPTVGFEDVKSVAPAVLNHRLILNYQARLEKVTPFDLIDLLLEKVDPAGIAWSSDVRVEEPEGGK